MHTFTSARRPKIVYGRIRGLQQRRQARAESSASSDSDARRSAGDAADSEDENDFKSAKENRSSAVKASTALPVLAKGKAASSIATTKRRPLQQKQNRSTSSDDVVTIETTDESATEAVRSPVQRRKARGTMARPIMICSSASSEASSSYASAEEDSDPSQDRSVDGAGVDSLSKQLNSVLNVSQVRSDLALLLDACSQKQALSFDSCLDDMERQASSSQWKKIGEATYSEVYSMQGSGKVLKVIPLLEGDDGEQGDESNFTSGAHLERSKPADVMREVNMTRSLSKTDETFVKLYRAAVVRGAYPARLLHAWDARPRVEADQNTRPDSFDDCQLYGLLLLSDGGKDLETVALSSWSQAASLFCQVTNALAHAERACQFEHRDLHWGNVVVQHIEAARPRRRRGKSGSGTPLLDIERVSSARWSGVQATIIDFTLSRACLVDADGGEDTKVTAHPFDDEAFFSGSGDIQFDVYRQMRAHTKADWRAFHPRTNVLWLRYLLIKIIDDKGLSMPAASTHDDVEATCFAFLSSVRDTFEEEAKDDSNHTTITDAAELPHLLSSILANTLAMQPAD